MKTKKQIKSLKIRIKLITLIIIIIATEIIIKLKPTIQTKMGIITLEEIIIIKTIIKTIIIKKIVIRIITEIIIEMI
jgi:hypothetical protein